MVAAAASTARAPAAGQGRQGGGRRQGQEQSPRNGNATYISRAREKNGAGMLLAVSVCRLALLGGVGFRWLGETS
eukprot:scaffold8531_cov130-Isochrysis_galbana.AAC.5